MKAQRQHVTTNITTFTLSETEIAYIIAAHFDLIGSATMTENGYNDKDELQYTFAVESRDHTLIDIDLEVTK